MRIPKQTSASHSLLYSHGFFIKLDFRRHCFCRISFLLNDRRDWEIFVAAIFYLVAQDVLYNVAIVTFRKLELCIGIEPPKYLIASSYLAGYGFK